MGVRLFYVAKVNSKLPGNAVSTRAVLKAGICSNVVITWSVFFFFLHKIITSELSTRTTQLNKLMCSVVLTFV